MTDRLAALEFMAAVPAYRELPKLVDAFATTVARFGVTHFSCVRIASPGRPVDLAPLFGRQHRAWEAHYEAERFVRDDGAVQLIFGRSRPFDWPALKARRRTREQAAIFGAAAEHGLRDGLVVPVHAGRGDVSVVQLLRDDAARLACDDRATLGAAAGLFAAHGLILAALEDDDPAAPGLTAREREVLAWVSRQKSDWEIGFILGIAERTVGYHLERIRAKLGVNSRNDAAIEAWRRGWLVTTD